METGEPRVLEEYFEPWGRWYHEQIYPAPDGLSIVSQDITDRKEQERNLTMARQRLELALERADAGIWEWNLETDELYWSDQLLAVLGYSQEEFSESFEFFDDKLHPDDTESTEEAIETALETGGQYHVEQRVKAANGEYQWLDVRGQVFEDDETTRMVGVGFDITEKRQRIVELQQWKRAIDASPTAIYITDIDGRIEYVNEGFEEMTGYSESEALGATPNILNSGVMSEEYFVELWETVLAGEEWEEEIINRRKSGATYAATQTIAPIRDETESLDGFVAVQSDITAQRQREQQLLVIDRLLRHDLRNDLTLIKGAAEMVSELGDSEVQEWAEKIVEASDHLLETAEKGREINQILVDEFEEEESIDLVSVVEGRIDGLLARYEAADIALDIPDSAPVVGDKRTGLIVEELVENAIVHNDMDTPLVEVTIEHFETETRLTVVDNGPGIEPVEYEELTLEKVYDPIHHGQGIGLWLVYWLLQTFDGSLEFQPNDPQGTVVTVRFQTA